MLYTCAIWFGQIQLLGRFLGSKANWHLLLDLKKRKRIFPTEELGQICYTGRPTNFFYRGGNQPESLTRGPYRHGGCHAGKASPPVGLTESARAAASRRRQPVAGGNPRDGAAELAHAGDNRTHRSNQRGKGYLQDIFMHAGMAGERAHDEHRGGRSNVDGATAMQGKREDGNMPGTRVCSP